MSHRDVILKRAEMLRDFPSQKLPEGDDELMEQAEAIARGTVFFYGSQPVEVGRRDIDWSGRHVHHQEWPAQLNRFHMLVPLAAAWKATGEGRFASAARGYIEDWIDHHPASGELSPRDNTLNMSLRLGSSMHAGWGGMLPALLDSPSFDDAFVDRVLASMEAQAAWLCGHLSDRGNWRISQLDALVFTALRFPFLDEAGRLLEGGLGGMRRALATQFLPDGVHIERTPSYHAWMARVLGHYHWLAGIFPEADAGVTREALRGPLDYMAHGALSGLNDATAPLTDPGEPGALDERRAVFPEDPPLEQVFPDAGQVFLRSSWTPGADCLAFDASTWGGAHSHLSRLAFSFRSGGRLLVADPGILSYEMSDPMGPYGKSTRAHSTLSIDGLNQSEADAGLLRTVFTPDVALIHAKYDGGYWSGRFGWHYQGGHGTGTFGIHERVLLWVKGEYLLALDRAETDDGATVHNVWQLGPMDAWELDASKRSWRSKNRDVNLLVRLLMPGEATTECFEGSTDPIRGWVGRRGNDRLAASLVEFRYPGRRFPGCFSAVLLAPFRGKEAPELEVRGTRTAAGGRVAFVELAMPDGSHDCVAWSNDLELPLEIGLPFVTDARFVWYRRDARGNLVKRFLLDGTYLDMDGTRVEL